MARTWLGFFIVVSSGILACQTSSSKMRMPASTTEKVALANAAPNPSPTVSPENSKIKTFNGRGVVTKIDLKLVSVELNHEEIPGLMPAMIMEFYVKEKRELEVLNVGDKVEFALEDNAGSERIISIKKVS